MKHLLAVFAVLQLRTAVYELLTPAAGQYDWACHCSSDCTFKIRRQGLSTGKCELSTAGEHPKTTVSSGSVNQQHLGCVVPINHLLLAEPVPPHLGRSACQSR